MTTSKPRQLHTYFIPMMAPGHMIPMIDIARQFSRRGAKTTIITTWLNASQFSQTIERDRQIGLDINISTIKFPCQESGLPDGCENLSSTTTFEMTLNFFQALHLLREPVEKVLQEGNPDCIVFGTFFWWAKDVALKLNIPGLVFYGTGFFPMCIYRSLKEHKPHQNVGSDYEEFVIPCLPDVVRISRRQLSDEVKDEDKHPMAETVRKILIAEATSHGMIVNSFSEMEPAYVKYYREVVGRKVWAIGPVSLFNNKDEDKFHRGKSSDYDCLSWLNSKRPDSVIYICFGSMSMFSSAQLFEIAKGLEISDQEFIWVIRENPKDEKGTINWLPEGFEKKTEGRGLIIRGWAPQVMILDHEAVGGFITHCGWNSVIEGVAAGVPMVTWPLSAEQFFNEKLVTEILKIGIPMGVAEWSQRTKERESVEGEKLANVVGRLMGGEEGDGMRRKARELGVMAKKAVEEGGSSRGDLDDLLEEIGSYCSES